MSPVTLMSLGALFGVVDSDRALAMTAPPVPTVSSVVTGPGLRIPIRL